jgi:hypothetical protein
VSSKVESFTWSSTLHTRDSHHSSGRREQGNVNNLHYLFLRTSMNKISNICRSSPSEKSATVFPFCNNFPAEHRACFQSDSRI